MAILSNKQLEVFCSVAETHNLGDTAEYLAMTRGAVSQAIKVLEQTLGVTLFERTQQRLKINSQGLLLLPYARQMLITQQSILSLFKEEGDQPPIRLGCSRTIGNYLLPKLLTRGLQSLVQTEVILANSETVQSQLEAYELDAGLIESLRIHPSLEQVAWYRDEMIVIAAQGHPLAGAEVSWAMLSAQEWILREKESGSREQFDLHIAPQLTQTRVVLQLGALDAILHSVAAGVGLTLISRLACQHWLETGRIVELAIPKEIKRELSLVYSKSSRDLPQIKRLIQLLAAIAESEI